MKSTRLTAPADDCTAFYGVVNSREQRAWS